jgi:hypothetical protein
MIGSRDWKTFVGILATLPLGLGCVVGPEDEGGEDDLSITALGPNQQEVFAAADTFVRSGSYANTQYGSATYLDADAMAGSICSSGSMR